MSAKDTNAAKDWHHDLSACLPEEWFADELITHDGKVIAATITSPTGYDLKAGKQHARLIAAAPDLLAALETVKRVLQGEQAMDIMLGVNGPILGNVIRDAIEKARGE